MSYILSCELKQSTALKLPFPVYHRPRKIRHQGCSQVLTETCWGQAPGSLHSVDYITVDLSILFSMSFYTCYLRWCYSPSNLTFWKGDSLYLFRVSLVQALLPKPPEITRVLCLAFNWIHSSFNLLAPVIHSSLPLLKLHGWVCICHVYAGACRSQKNVLNSLETVPGSGEPPDMDARKVLWSSRWASISNHWVVPVYYISITVLQLFVTPDFRCPMCLHLLPVHSALFLTRVVISHWT